MPHKYVTKADKKAAILLEFATITRRLEQGETYKTAYSAREVAEILGYKSAASVREVLYELVDADQIRMEVKPRVGVIDNTCYFIPKGYRLFGDNMKLWEAW